MKVEYFKKQKNNASGIASGGIVTIQSDISSYLTEIPNQPTKEAQLL